MWVYTLSLIPFDMGYIGGVCESNLILTTRVRIQLEMGRIVIEREALLWFQQEHGDAAM